jgi:ABC-type polysaccharide/polyol phosphate export permease
MTFPVLLALVWIDARGPSVAYLALPVVMAVQILVLLALGYLVAALNVLFRDMQHIVPILLQLGYFLTPIFYDTSMVAPALRRVLALNPMFHVVEAYRAILIAGAWPDWPALAAVAALALAGLALTLRYFLRASLRFLEEI